jgi:hypothetical protein
MQIKVLKELPQGQQPGQILDVHDDIAQVLILCGAAKAHPAPALKREYQRRDMEATGQRTLTTEP